MKEQLTREQAEYFLSDYGRHSETVILESGSKEEKELHAIARAKGMTIRNSRDLSLFKTVYAFTDRPNKNGAILPEKQILKVLPQLVGKPISLNHIRNKVIGHYMDYRYNATEKKIIAYGVFYKSNFPELFSQAKKLFKKKKLATSFEIWSPEKGRKELPNGNFIMNRMEIAGGALLLDEEPAFEGTDVLALAKKIVNPSSEMVYASKYKEDEMIVSENFFKKSVEENVRKLAEEQKAKETEATKEEPKEAPKEAPKAEEKPNEKKEEAPQEEKKEETTPEKVEDKKEDKVEKEEVKEEDKVPEPLEEGKVKCSHCENIFDKPDLTMNQFNCPKCRSIVNAKGEEIYPPQIKDFKLSCSACKNRNWLITKSSEEATELRCLSCSKEYKVEFAKEKHDELLDQVRFLYSNTIACIQCGKTIPISTTSKVEKSSISCPKCGLKFNFDIKQADRYKKISKIDEIEPIAKSSVEGGKNGMTEKDQKAVDNFYTAIKAPKEGSKTWVDELVEAKKEEVTQAEVAPSETEEQLEESKKTKKKANVGKTSTDAGHFHLANVDANGNGETFRTIATKDGNDNPHVHKIVRRRVMEADGHIHRLTVSAVKYTDTVKKVTKRVRKEKKAKKKALAKATLYESGVKKLASIVISLREEMKKIDKEAGKKVDFYKANAKEIIQRREELGTVGKELSDKDIMNQDKFEKAQLQVKYNLLKAKNNTKDIVVGTKKSSKEQEDAEILKAREEINEKAFKGKKRNQIKNKNEEKNHG